MLKISKLSAEIVEGNPAVPASRHGGQNERLTRKQVLKSVSVEINPGEVHMLTGRNGSGKSSFAAALAGLPHIQLTSGKIKLINESYPKHISSKVSQKLNRKAIDLTNLDPDARSLLGLFLAIQYPPEIPGVSLSNFLRLAYNARQEQDIPVFKFRKLLKERAKLINYPEHLLDRNLNEGFSGGEKKKTEILQLAILEPRYAILDETDSGLDKHAVTEVFNGLNELRKTVLKNTGFIIISHYDKIREFLRPDFVHHMEDGCLTPLE